MSNKKASRQKHAWPITAKIRMQVCPRCGESHGEVEFRRFELGDAQFTHWAYCPATGEPLLLSMTPDARGEPTKFRVRWVGGGCGIRPRQVDAKFIDGRDVETPPDEKGNPCCKVDIPYPAKELGAWKVECTECLARITVMATGHLDDPKSVQMPCQR